MSHNESEFDKWEIKVNRRDIWDSVLIKNGESNPELPFTLAALLAEHQIFQERVKFLDEIIDNYESAVNALRKRFVDYLLEAADDQDDAIFLDQVSKGVTKERDGWAPVESAAEEIEAWEEMMNED